MPMVRTQEARGEPSRDGPDYADPFALQRQLTVARTAIASSSGIAENQGLIQGRQERHLPAPPQPQGSVADHSSHLWRYRCRTRLRRDSTPQPSACGVLKVRRLEKP